VALTKRTSVVPSGAICFGCNQSFEGNPVGLQFETDLLDPPHGAELEGLFFHPGHLHHYARRRGWANLERFLAENGPANY
jgi:hypothetical protein